MKRDSTAPSETLSAAYLDATEPDPGFASTLHVEDVEPNPEAQTRKTVPVSTTPPFLAGESSSPHDMFFTPGDTIKHYELIRELGRGGMGRVFLARDTKLARLCAIKLLLAYTGKAAERFLGEARATARCVHESIVVVYEVDEILGYPYMVLEYLEGQTLRQWMKERASPAPSRLSVELIIPVVKALVCAHEQGLVHRDLKPENILITTTGQVKVLDFGIAKRFEPSAPISVNTSLLGADSFLKTQGGAVVGTPAYMSPEQWLGVDVDPQSDIWALGLILHELIMGAHPLEPITLARLVGVSDLDLPMPGVQDKRPDEGPLFAVIDRCLQKQKSARMSTAAQLLDELEAFAEVPKVLALPKADNPFAGLSAFQETDAARFFGRDRDTASVLGRLRHQQLIVVAGPSGAGKSSFVRAGLIPALKRSEERWEAFILRPGHKPLAALADVLTQVGELASSTSLPPPTDSDDFAISLRSRPGYAGACLRAFCRRTGREHRVLLFVDQFEELYTLGADPSERAAFLACLGGIADDASSPLRVVLAVRSDFLDRMTDDRNFTLEAMRGLVLLPPIGREGLRDALTRPIEAAKYRFESDALVEQILDELSSTRGPLPLLQFAASKLWEMRDRRRKRLTRQSYRSLGGVAGALSVHADSVLATLSATEQRLARSILLRLVTPERTRAVVNLDELCGLAEDSGAATHVIHHLAGARLLFVETGEGREGAIVELVHESLIESWGRLRSWLEEDEKDAEFLARLRPAAKQWETSGRAEGLLWRDQTAKEARVWLERRRVERKEDAHVGLGAHEQAFLAAVIVHFEGAQQRRRRQITGVIATLVVFVSVVSYQALSAKRENEHLKEEISQSYGQFMKEEAQRSRNAVRAAVAHASKDNPTTVLSLLREMEPGPLPRKWTNLVYRALDAGVASRVFMTPSVINAVGFSPDGKRVVVGSADKTIRVWGVDMATPPLILGGHKNGVLSVAFSPDGKQMVSSSTDQTVRVWNADGVGSKMLEGHGDRVNSAAFSPDGKHIVSASDDKTVRIWSVASAQEEQALQGHDNAVISAAFSPNGRRVVSASADQTVRVWNVDDARNPVVLAGHTGRVTSAAFSPDGERIVSASEDETVRIWHADGRGAPITLKGHDDRIVMAAFSPDGEHVVSASHDRTLRIWNANGEGSPRILKGHEGYIYAAALSIDGKQIISGSIDRTVRVWNIDDVDTHLSWRAHDKAINATAFSPDGKRIVSASEDKTVRVWNADGSGTPLLLAGHDDSVWMAAFSPDGKRIVSASEDKTVRVWNADGSGAPVILKGHTDTVFTAAFSPDNEHVVSSSWDKTVRVWNADGGGAPVVLQGHTDIIRAAAFSPDGRRIVSASDDKTARVWNADGSGEPYVFEEHHGGVLAVAFSPDGKRIVSASKDRDLRVWSADGSGLPLLLTGHRDSVAAVAFSPDGKLVASASHDNDVRIWNVDGSGQPMVLTGHQGSVFAVTFSPDGKRVVSSSRDGSGRVWWVDGSQDPIVLPASTAIVDMATFSPDGQRVVAACGDNTISVWNDITTLRGADDPKLWGATNYCMPVELRRQLLDFSEDQARDDRKRCEDRVGRLAVGGR